MNKKYSTLLDSTLEQIDDLSKKLSRPIKDLDDIRVSMGALKEIRENEIKIDMLLSPIEVYVNAPKHSCYLIRLYFIRNLMPC